MAADDGQDPSLQVIEGTGVPVFGRRSTPFDERKYRRFALEVETDDERFDVEFDAYFDADAGAILGLMNARTQWQQANATAVLLGTSLRDNDGVSADWQFPTEPEYDDDGNLLRLDGSPEDAPPVPLYEWHDGELLTAAELRESIDEFDPLEEGSSRRRFQYVMDSARHRVQLEALNALAEWVSGDAAKRPTRRPTSSQRGQSRTSRTRGGRR